MKFFTLSFDDGTVQDRRFVKLLNTYQLKSTFNLNSGLFSTKHEIVHEGIRVCHDEIEPEEVRVLYVGHEIAAHTVTHPNLLKCTREEVSHQVGDDAKALEALCGYPIVGMAYPGGPYFSDETIDVITSDTKIFYARAVGSHFTFAMPERLMAWYPTCQFHPKQYEELDRLTGEFLALDPDGPDALFYLWGHSFELDKFGNWDDFERFCERIAGKADIHYVTNREVAYYLTSGKKG